MCGYRIEWCDILNETKTISHETNNDNNISNNAQYPYQYKLVWS